jgi:hypothetical protein
MPTVEEGFTSVDWAVCEGLLPAGNDVLSDSQFEVGWHSYVKNIKTSFVSYFESSESSAERTWFEVFGLKP